jgi:serine/threonine-protein kinase
MLGKTLGGRYLLRDVLGSGGMGTVFEAEHLGLKRTVAIKVLNPSQARKKTAVKRFQQEARAAGSIGHPNICEVYDLGALDDGSPYLVMEKLTGRTLAQRLQKETRLSPDDVVETIIQALSGLGAAHDKGIVHRDIKPDNIFIAKRAGAFDIVKVVDFGVSKIFARGDDAEGGEELDLTRTGMVMGTPYYMSPEQASGERNLDARVDIYACGVVMYEAVTGRRPFLAPNYNALLLKIIAGTYKSPRELVPDVSPAFEAVVKRAMAGDRQNRYASASEMQRDLIGLRPSAAPVPKPPPRRSVVDDLPPIIQPKTRKEGGLSADLDETMIAGNRNKRATVQPAPQPPPRPPPPNPPSELEIHIEFSESSTGPVQQRPAAEAHGPPSAHLPQDPAAIARAKEWEDELPTEIYQPNKQQPAQRQPAPPAQAWHPPQPTHPGSPANPVQPAQIVSMPQARGPHPEKKAWDDSNTTLHRPGIFDDDDDDDDDDLHTRKVSEDIRTLNDPRLKPRPR